MYWIIYIKPIEAGRTVLYSNKALLEKYNKTVPETWDELIDTANFIIQKEKENGNEDIIGYNGLFNSKNFKLYYLIIDNVIN